MAKALIIEDDKITLKVLEMMIKRAGHEVIALSDGRDLAHHLKDEGIMFFVVDLNLPFVSGEQLVQEIAATRKGAQIYITSGSPRDSVSKDLLALCAGYIDKPYTQQRIKNELIVALNKQL